MKNRAFKIICSLLIFGIFSVGLYLYLLSDFNNLYQDENFILLKKSIKNSKKEDLKDFVEIYNKTHTIISYKKSLLSGYNYKVGMSPFHDAVNSRLYRYDSQIEANFKNILYALKLEEDFTADECLTYLFLNCDYLYGNKGIKDASIFFFKKSIKNLTLKEKITLVIMLDNPSLYNPFRERDILKRRIKEYEKML
ncbi:transglycosylase domain-containing protein [Flavobacterium sp. H122]|uniref:transglycosylase domain-containing protein n=1 Tax=Flavobacterium sp. H122 TaxID=2529860 RepID=UPI0010A9E2B5|nr:transglycosylase domain-containing protein [Flavobacterium sp. H122]